MCKAGGLVITEALACGRPMILIDAIPGQETGNADYVVQNEAGALALSPVEVLEILADWLRDDGALLKQRAQNACRLGKAEAANDVADILWQAAHHRAKAARGAGRVRLVDFLSRNHIDVTGQAAGER
jgi:1,2-diacylglycerol 3-beta-galactosyltransferase